MSIVCVGPSSPTRKDTNSRSSVDPGLFGPDSVTWRVHSDPVMAVAGLRALLVQALHPIAMAGVASHSVFRADYWGRLSRTADYLGEITFGTTDAARAAADRVRRAHARVGGTDPGTGRRYRADDPELLLWIHVSAVESFLSTARRCGLGLTGHQADAYYREQVRAAELVGLDPRLVPASRRQVAAYFGGMVPNLRITPAARSAVRLVLSPPMPRWLAWTTPARPAWFALSLLAVGLLPGWARELYGLPRRPRLGAAVAVGGTVVRATLRALPPEVRESPHLRAARSRLGLDQPRTVLSWTCRSSPVSPWSPPPRPTPPGPPPPGPPLPGPTTPEPKRYAPRSSMPASTPCAQPAPQPPRPPRPHPSCQD